MRPEDDDIHINLLALCRDLFSSSLGSILCCYTGQPLDTVKVRMQTNPGLYQTIWQSTRKMAVEEGLPALWKGSVPTVLGMVAENGVAFGLYEGLKRVYMYKNEDPHPHRGDPSSDSDSSYLLLQRFQHSFSWQSILTPFALGSFTGICSAIVLLPSEVIKAKTQVVTDISMTSTHVYQQMIKTHGYKSLLCGFDAQLMRDGVFYGVFFGGYDLFCHTLQTAFPSIPEELNYFLSGGFAGMLGWIVAMPFDVPKTNIQSRYDTYVLGSYFPEMARIYKQHGIAGFYNGLGPTLLRAFPANAALFCGVEMGKKFWDEHIS